MDAEELARRTHMNVILDRGMKALDDRPRHPDPDRFGVLTDFFTRTVVFPGQFDPEDDHRHTSDPSRVLAPLLLQHLERHGLGMDDVLDMELADSAPAGSTSTARQPDPSTNLRGAALGTRANLQIATRRELDSCCNAGHKLFWGATQLRRQPPKTVPGVCVERNDSLHGRPAVHESLAFQLVSRYSDHGAVLVSTMADSSLQDTTLVGAPRRHGVEMPSPRSSSSRAPAPSPEAADRLMSWATKPERYGI
ncbi:hypothetical protein ABZ599_32740 [Streptomyces misionensis]|uniref:hypothetical protein n=1 Tax=Streptomyces misionensis TaxID=67331 RepID=UPI0033C99C41